MARSSPLRPARPEARGFSWTGFYVGGTAGYGWGDANDRMLLGSSWLTDGTGDNVGLQPRGNDQLKPGGFAGGIEAGYNHQIGQWVLGIEADANYIRMKDGFFSGPFLAGASPYTVTSSFESTWLVTVRPRLGVAVDQWLIYVTGGLAVANQKFSQNITQLNVAFSEQGSVSKTTAGWTVGAGAAYALDAAGASRPNISMSIWARFPFRRTAFAQVARARGSHTLHRTRRS